MAKRLGYHVRLFPSVVTTFDDILERYDNEVFRYTHLCLTAFLRSLEEGTVLADDANSKPFREVIRQAQESAKPLSKTITEHLESVSQLNPRLRVVGRYFPTDRDRQVQILLFFTRLDGTDKARDELTIQVALPTILRNS